jgi:hypothetical protein
MVCAVAGATSPALPMEAATSNLQAILMYSSTSMLQTG